MEINKVQLRILADPVLFSDQSKVVVKTFREGEFDEKRYSVVLNM